MQAPGWKWWALVSIWVAAWGGEPLARTATVRPSDVIISGEKCPIAGQLNALVPVELTAEFAPYAKFVRRCPIGQRGLSPALFVISVDVNDYYTSLPGKPTAEAIPKPVLVGADKTFAGRLPMPFPNSGPVSARLRFGAWHDNWPSTLNIAFESDAVGAPDPMMMVFNPTTRLFEREALPK